MTLLTQADATSGDSPSTSAGPTTSSVQATASFGRLISESRLPASASSERRLVLEASSSRSPRRGSRTGFTGLDERCRISPRRLSRTALNSFYSDAQNCCRFFVNRKAGNQPVGYRLRGEFSCCAIFAQLATKTIDAGACSNTAAAVSPKKSFSPGRRPTPMMMRSHSAFLDSVRIAWSGATSERTADLISTP